MNLLMNRGLEQVPERWRPRLRNFLIYILPVILGEIILGIADGDMSILEGMLPALAIWGLTGRIQAVPITWVVLLIGKPALAQQFDGVNGAIWFLTAIALGAGMVRIGQQRLLSNQDQHKKEQKPTTWCEPCQKEVRPVRPQVPIGSSTVCIALGWLILLPLVLFAISRLAKEAICPDCRQHIPGAKVPFDTEAAVMIGLIVLCVGGGIGALIIDQMNQPSAECTAALETVKEGGGPDLWTISEADLDRWMEEEPNALEILENLDSACWPEDEETP